MATDSSRANAGSSGGAANELGSQFRAEITAWIVAHGLADVPLPALAGLRSTATPQIIALESDSKPDDIVVWTRAGQEIRIQAKRTLAVSSSNPDFRSVVDQLVAGAQDLAGKDGSLVIATTPTAPLRALSTALGATRAAFHAALTVQQERSLDELLACLAGIDGPVRDAVLGSTQILFFSLEGVTDYRDAAIAHLESAVVVRGSGDRAFERLVTTARTLATKRLGWHLGDWLADLSSSGVPLRKLADGTLAERMEARSQALERYRALLRARARQLDLRGLGIPLPPIEVILNGCIRVQGLSIPHVDFTEAVRRHRRVTLVGLPGSGKSTALSVLAGNETNDPDGALPLKVRLTSLQGDLTNLTERMLEIALDDVSASDRDLLRDAAHIAIELGQAIWLLDGLDECFGWHDRVVSEIDRWSRSSVGACDIVLSTRDATSAFAETLGWPCFDYRRQRILPRRYYSSPLTLHHLQFRVMVSVLGPNRGCGRSSN